jgi:hypothetical protein
MQQVEVTTLGDYPEGTTPNAPASPYDKWDGEKWVTDTDAKHKVILLMQNNTDKCSSLR